MHITDIERREILRYMGMFDFREFLQDKTFLVTGAGGIIGTGIIKWILMENEVYHCNTHIIASTRNLQKDSENVAYCSFGHELETVQERKVDYILHAASPTSNLFHQQHPTETFRVNVGGMERMLEIAKRYKSTVLYLSSEEVYGTPQIDTPIAEEYVGSIDSMNLRSCYPLAKKACELLCCGAVHEYGVNAKIIRPTSIQGLFQRRDETRVANEILNCIIDGHDLHMKSDGMTQKCIIYSLDAIAAIFTVLFKGNKGEAYNASNPATFMTVKNMAATLFEKFAPDCRIIFERNADTAAMGFLPHRTLQQDISKIRQLGWEPKTSLEDIYRIDIERLKAAVQ